MTEYIELKNIKSYSIATALVEQFPYIFKITNEYPEKSDELEEIFNSQFLSADNDKKKYNVLVNINRIGEQFISEKNNIENVERSKKLLENSGIEPKRQNDCFSSFYTSTEILEKAKFQAMSYIQNVEKVKEGKNLIILGYGDVGTGKTHLAISVAKEAINKQIPVIFVNSTQMLMQLKKDFDISPYVDAKLLIIDDLSKINTTSWVMEQLYLILDTRYNKGRPTVITAENTLEDLEVQFGKNGKALISRLCSDFTLIKCQGDDYRLKRN